jgi:long-chain acyl-CoA synthetase
MNLGTLPSRHARYRLHHTAVVFEGRRVTFRKFNTSANRLAHAHLDHGTARGEKIATLLPNCLELLEIYWATAKTGAVVVPLSPMLRGKGLSSLL